MLLTENQIREMFEKDYLGSNKKLMYRDSTSGAYALPSINDAWNGFLAAIRLMENNRPKFNVSKAKMVAGGKTTFFVNVDHPSRSPDASVFDTQGRLNVFSSENEQDALIERLVWDSFLNGNGSIDHSTAIGDVCG